MTGSPIVFNNLAALSVSQGACVPEPRRVTTDILDDGEPFDATVSDFIDYLDVLLADIGADRETGRVHLRLEHDFEDTYVRAYVYRHETDEERTAREAHEAEQLARYKSQSEEHERLMYEQLKAKYEP
jgi:hypothetical protein